MKTIQFRNTDKVLRTSHITTINLLEIDTLFFLELMIIHVIVRVIGVFIWWKFFIDKTLDLLQPIFCVGTCPINECLVYLHIILKCVPVNDTLAEDFTLLLIQWHMRILLGPLLYETVELRLFIYQIDHQLRALS
jgi:hypothetical protein